MKLENKFSMVEKVSKSIPMKTIQKVHGKYILWEKAMHKF